jgi:hypothetical protein
MPDISGPGWRDRIRAILRPPTHPDPDEARALRVSHLLSWAIVVAVVPPWFLNLGEASPIPEILLAAEFLVGLCAVWQVKKGRWQIANSLLMFSSLAMAIGLILAAPNGMRDISAFILPTLVVLSALMMTSQAAMIFAAVVTGSVAILFGIEILGIRETADRVSTDDHRRGGRDRHVAPLRPAVAEHSGGEGSGCGTGGGECLATV